jgi:hypothetical protein
VEISTIDFFPLDRGAKGSEPAGQFVDFRLVGFRGASEAGGQDQLGRDCQETEEVGIRIADLAFGDVGGDRDRRSPELGGETGALGARG